MLPIITRVGTTGTILALLLASLPGASADTIDLTLNNSDSSVTDNPYGASDGKVSVTAGGGAFQ